jgi:hypothetical protein
MATTTYYDPTFSARVLGLKTDNTGSDQTPDLTAEEDRFESADISAGYVTADAFEVVEATVWDVTVGSLVTDVDVYAVAGTAAGQGVYLVRMDQAGDTITLSAADGSNPRIDEIYLVVADNDYDSGTESLPRLALREGVAASSPSAPGVDSEWTASVLLATIDLPAAAADITACTITDERAMSQLIVDAPTLQGLDSTDFSDTSHDHDATYADLAHVNTDDEHPVATGSLPGFMSPDDFAKMTTIESGAEVNHTNAEVLTEIKTVDGPGSGLDADLVDGVHASGLALSAHSHTSRYFTEAEENAALAGKANSAEWIYVKLGGSAQSIPNNTYTDIVLDSTVFDDWGGHASPAARVDCDDDGLYLINIQVQFQSANGGTFRLIEIYHAVDGGIAQERTHMWSGGQIILQASVVYRMEVGEGVKIRVKHNYGSNINVDTTKTWLQMVKLGGEL